MGSNSKTKIWSVIDILQWGQEFFAKKSFSSPRLLTELLLCKVLNCRRIDLYLNFDKPLSDLEINELKSLILHILKHEPLQYVLEEVHFLDLTLKVRKGVFIPRPETEQLVAFALEEFKFKKDDKLLILDIGCGTGAIAIALAKFFLQSDVLAIDLSDLALSISKENAYSYGLKNITFRKMDILREIHDKKFDLIVSNPPYIPFDEVKSLERNVRKEPLDALTDFADGLSFYRRFAEIFSKILKRSGKFYIEIGFDQADEVKKIFLASGYEIKFYQDFQNIKRIITNA